MTLASQIREFVDELLPERGPCSLEGPEPETVDQDEARAALLDFAGRGAQGWACATDRVVRVRRPDDLPSNFPLLSAELALDEESLALRAGEAGLLLVRTRRVEGDEYRAVRHRYVGLLGTEPGEKIDVEYEVYWPASLPDGPLDEAWAEPVGPRAARFVGIVNCGEEG